ncbi:MAG TPA: cation:proton antiporter [Desulfobaccales bacterium]
MKNKTSRFLLLLLLLAAAWTGLLAVSHPAGAHGVEVSVAQAATPAAQADQAADAAGHHGDPFARVFLVLAVLLVCAMLGHFGALKLKQSPVLGELAVGIIIGARGLLLTLVAMFGKMAPTAILKQGYRKLAVGFGLVPRGEVTLIFASLGKSMGILSTSLYSILIIVVLLTTLVTPPLLKWAVERPG